MTRRRGRRRPTQTDLETSLAGTALGTELRALGLVRVSFIFPALKRLCTVLGIVPVDEHWVPEALLNVARVERDLTKRSGKLSSSTRRAFNRAAAAMLANKPIPETFARQYGYYVALSVELTAQAIAEKQQ